MKLDTRLDNIGKTNFIQHEKRLKKHKKTTTTNYSINYEFNCVIQTLILIISILAFSYHSIRNGQMEYSLLENGQMVHGLVSLRKVVVILSVGYPLQYAIINALTALMALYSLVSLKPQWSVPLIILSMADLVSNIGDAIIAIWLLFLKLEFHVAMTYTTGVVTLILGQLWVWIGLIRLYELRTFQ